MRSLVAPGLALLIAVPAVRADPGTPQLAPVRRQREDAQRLSEQLRGLDAPEPVAAPRAEPSAPRAVVVDRGRVAREPSLAERWWFWAALGAVAVTVGVTYEATRSSAPPLAGVTCDASGCHP